MSDASPSWDLSKNDDDVLEFAEFAKIDRRKKRKDGEITTKVKPKESKKLKLKPKPKAELSLGFQLQRKVETELWSDKYKPTAVSQLAVHTQRITAVREWLRSVGGVGKGGVMVLAGPPGCGKAATLTCAGTAEGVALRWWRAPVLKVWDSGNSVGGSALGAFRDFLRRAGMFPDLSLSSSRSVVVVDELPWLGDAKLQGDFASLLNDYLLAAVQPVVFILDNDEAYSFRRIASQEFLSSPKVTWTTLNPIAPTKMKKVLTSIAQKENPTISADVINAICEKSDGDLRQAINSLQFFSVGSRKTRKSRKQSESNRDPTLSLFHAVGKIMYNKRLEPPKGHVGKPPLEFSPEDVINNVHLDASTFVSFLHENYLSFFTDVDDIAHAADYLCESDSMLQFMEHNLLSSYSASVATRGLLYSNNHEVPRRFTAIHKPQLHHMRPLLQSNKAKVRDYSLQRQFGTNVGPSSTIFCEVLPFMKKILPRKPTPFHSFMRSMCSFSPPHRIERMGLNTKIEKDVTRLSEVDAKEESDFIDEIEEFED